MFFLTYISIIIIQLKLTIISKWHLILDSHSNSHNWVQIVFFSWFVQMKISTRPTHCIFFFRFFKMWTIFKVFIEFVTILLLLFVYVLAFWPWRYGILASPPGTEHIPPALEDKDLTTGLPQKSLYLFFMSLKLLFILQ